MLPGEQVRPGAGRAVADSPADGDPNGAASGVATAEALSPAGRLPPAEGVPRPNGPSPGADAAPDAAPYATAGSVSRADSEELRPPCPVPATGIGSTGPAITDRIHVIPPTSTSPPTRMKNRRRQ
jgi:hypothetical protein